MARKQVIDDDFIENIQEIPLEKAVHSYMMPFSEYIILERAIPRVEDGLKPVQRRILFTMHELSMKPDGPTKKSARIVGDCLGKYHPHGDSSIYEAIVNMAQDFSIRMPLVYGQGNFGSIDGDSAAAMRYTEVKPEYLACELLRDLEKDTVKWNKNFDDSLWEPDILPGRFPNLLVNGAKGIAIAIATNIPSHNLTEIIDATILLIDKPTAKLDEVLSIVKGPDFPTGGFATGDFKEIYTTGRGTVTMRGKADIENDDSQKQSIIITEIPYGVNKATLLQKIASLRSDLAAQKDKNGEKVNNPLAGIAEIAEESDKSGIRVVIRLKKGEDAAKVLDFLYKKTQLQCNFNVNMTAIADGKPQTLGIIPILKYYIRHQKEIIYKRSLYDLNIAKNRAHILKGLIIAIQNIDEVVDIIKNASSTTDAKNKLMERFSLTDIQATEILNMKLRNLTKLEVSKLEKELEELLKLIDKLTKIVNSDKEQYKVVKEELAEIRDKYKTRRLTRIVDSMDDIDYTPQVFGSGKRGYVVVNSTGLVKFVSPRQFIGANRDITACTPETLAKITLFTEKEQTPLLFSEQGFCCRLDTAVAKENSWTYKGDALSTMFGDVPADDKCVGAIIVSPEEVTNEELIFFTESGLVKRTLLREYLINKDVFPAISLKEGDRVVNVELIKSPSSAIIVTEEGLCVNVDLTEFPTYGRKTAGIVGMSLNDGDKVCFAGQCEGEEDDDGLANLGELVIITTNGLGKRIVIGNEIEIMKRARKGIKITDLDKKTRLLFVGLVTNPYDIAILCSDGKTIEEVNTEDIRIDRRISKGKSLLSAANAKLAVAHKNEA